VNRIEPVAASASMIAFDHARRRSGWLLNAIRLMARGTNAADRHLKPGGLNAGGAVVPLARELIAIEVAEDTLENLDHNLARRELDPVQQMHAETATER
jgi:hypothetical protein